MRNSIATPLSPIPRQGEEDLQHYNWLRHVYTIDKGARVILSTLMILSLFLLTVLMFAQVLLRYVVKLPFLGIEEMAPLLAVWTYFLAICYATRERRQIGGGMLVLVVKNKTIVKLVRLIGSIITLAVLGVFSYFAIKMMLFNIEINRLSSYMKIPRYFWSMSSAVGITGSVFYLAIQVCVETVDLYVHIKKNAIIKG